MGFSRIIRPKDSRFLSSLDVCPLLYWFACLRSGFLAKIVTNLRRGDGNYKGGNEEDEFGHRKLPMTHRKSTHIVEEYANLLKESFRPSFEKSFTPLHQIGSTADFNVEFNLISAKLILSQDYLIGAYISALKTEIRAPLRMFSPQTLIKARTYSRHTVPTSSQSQLFDFVS